MCLCVCMVSNYYNMVLSSQACVIQNKSTMAPTPAENARKCQGLGDSLATDDSWNLVDWNEATGAGRKPTTGWYLKGASVEITTRDSQAFRFSPSVLQKLSLQQASTKQKLAWTLNFRPHRSLSRNLTGIHPQISASGKISFITFQILPEICLSPPWKKMQQTSDVIGKNAKEHTKWLKWPTNWRIVFLMNVA